MKWIRLPIEVLCYCESNKSKKSDHVEMTIEVDDPEVPTYRATCPKCKGEIIIAFGDFLTKDQDKKSGDHGV